jgi:ribosome-associated translation inhibitor RaiA
MLDVAKGVDILIIYSSKELLSYEEIYSGIGLIIEKINRQLSKNKTDEQIPADS